MATKSVINEEKIRKTVTTLKTITSRYGLEILKLIEEKGEVNVNEIYQTLKIEQSMTSQFLARARKYKFVTSRREGKKIYYKVNFEVLNPILAFAEKF